MNKHDKIRLVKMPQIGVNDDEAQLIQWHIADGDKVKLGDIISTLETTKAAFDTEADASGYLIHLAEENQTIKVNEPFALITPDLKEGEKYKLKLQKEISEASGSIKATKKALTLAKENNINIEDIEVEGIIKEKDVKNFAIQSGLNITSEGKVITEKNNNIEQIIDLIGNQKMGKTMMLESLSNIPHSYVERIVQVNKLKKKTTAYIEQEGKVITMLSIIICSLAQALTKHEMFNSYRKGDQIFVYKDINIGVVMTHDNSISIPIIKNADNLHPADVVKKLMEIRKSIMKRKPNIEDLTGGTFTVSAMDHTEVTRFIPIVHPQQAAVLAIPKVQTNNEVDEKGSVTQNQYMNLGISFDHSFLDANQANEFLGSLIEEMDRVVNTL